MPETFAFFACADEQVTWWSNLTARADVWCVVDSVKPPGMKAREVAPEVVVQFIKACSPDQLRVFMGRRDLSEQPIWRTTAHRLELDFVKSRAVQFIPSMSAGDVLVEGSLGIADPGYYRDAGLLVAPLRSWLKEMCDSLRFVIGEPSRFAVRSPSSTVVQSTRRLNVSPGARTWREQGGRLKQIAESTIEYELVESTPGR